MAELGRRDGWRLAYEMAYRPAGQPPPTPEAIRAACPHAGRDTDGLVVHCALCSAELGWRVGVGLHVCAACGRGPDAHTERHPVVRRTIEGLARHRLAAGWDMHLRFDVAPLAEFVARAQRWLQVGDIEARVVEAVRHGLPLTEGKALLEALRDGRA